jgi:lysyl-tRNA synthetase class 1
MKLMKSGDWIYWTDRVAQDVKKRVEKSDILKKVVEERGYIVYDEKTPSGNIHIGSGRGWIIHDCIAKSMRKAGMNARFILSSDDIDPFDSIPKTLEKEKYEKYLGKPLIYVPSPVKGYKHYGDYFFGQCTEKFDEIGIEAELESTAQRYIDGDFNKTIKIVLNNAEKIQKIYKKIYGKSMGTEKLPFNPICEKCGSIGTTVAYEWDSKKEIVKYKCVPHLVDWATGCGNEGEISPYNGNGKLPWKVEWAAKWPTVGVVYESAGKDHFTLGGSRSIAVAISCEVFNYPPPYPSTCKNIGKGYEFFLVGGKKMSTSKGLGSSFVDMFNILPAYMLRFLMVKTRPEATIDFTPEGNTIPLLFNEFDKVEKIYFGLEDVDQRTKQNAKRIYELSTIGETPKQKPFRISFDSAVMIVQILTHGKREEAVDILRRSKQLDKELTLGEKKNLEEVMKYTEVWVRDFAPENYRIGILESVSKNILNKLTKEQKRALNELGEFLKTNRNEQEIRSEIMNIGSKIGIKASKIFEAAYLVLLGKTYGPRLVPFIQSLDKNFVIKRFLLKS